MSEITTHIDNLIFEARWIEKLRSIHPHQPAAEKTLTAVREQLYSMFEIVKAERDEYCNLANELTKQNDVLISKIAAMKAAGQALCRVAGYEFSHEQTEAAIDAWIKLTS
jgi:hypothetical protein